MNTQEIFDELRSGNAEILLNAVATFNADAFLIEDLETAEEVAEFLLGDSVSVMTASNTDEWEWITAYEKLDFTSLNQPDRIISTNSVLVCLADDYKPLDMKELKEGLYGALEFTKEEYREKVAAALDMCDFETFLENNLKAAIECNGTLDDAAFNANDAFSKMTERDLLPHTLYELAELINKSEEYPVNTVYQTIKVNDWVNTESDSEYDICSDGNSRLVIDCNSGEAVVR